MSVVVCCLPDGWEARAARGLLGAGQRLARAQGAELHLIVGGPLEAAALAEAAAVTKTVHLVNHALVASGQLEVALNVFTQLCQQLRPATILLGNELRSQEIAPRLAHRLKGCAAADAVDLQFDGQTVCVTRPVYGGKALAAIALPRSPAVVWLRARAFAPPEPAGCRPGEIVSVEVEAQPDERVRVVARHSDQHATIRLEDAHVIVSGGRGLGGPEAFRHLQSLADVLGAQVAASRAACDAGWAPHSWQVGQTGRKVGPALYIAVGISGASQHMMGITDAKVVAAINHDPQAPIFKRCRFGLVEDYRKVIGPLCDRLAACNE
ncbi:MAG: electron transfer flavoprotein subunit alpha/FixB family protein [Planctomycetaceae bacterium]